MQIRKLSLNFGKPQLKQSSIQNIETNEVSYWTVYNSFNFLPHQVKQEGQLTSDDYEMVDYMLNQFKAVVGINGNSKKKRRKSSVRRKSMFTGKGDKDDGPDFEKCVGFDF